MTLGAHGIRAQQWWSTNPLVGPTGTATTWVGVKFEVDCPGRLFGMRTYRSSGNSDAPFGIVWDETTGDIVAAKHWYPEIMPSAGWRNAWIKPVVRLDETHTYFIAVMYYLGRFFRNTGGLSSDVVHDCIRFKSSFQSTALYPARGTTTTNTNTNAVDILFHPDGA